MSVAQTDFVVYCFSFLIMKPLITNDALCNDAACSQFRTLPPGSWRAPGDVIISHLCSARCLGFLCGSASCLRLQPSSTSPCPATPRVTWLTTVGSSPTPVSDNCVLPTLENTLVISRTHSSFGDRTFAAAGPQVWKEQSATQSQPMWAVIVCHTSSGYWRHFYSDSEATAQCELYCF